MPRFSDPSYHLPLVEAMVPGVELGDSANKPVVLTCVETATDPILNR